MSSASLITVPVKPSSSRSTRSATGLSVAGSGPHSGTTRCPVITRSTPARTAEANGTSSTARSSASVRGSTARLWCESVVDAPWPGKCLAHALTPAACVPRTNAATCAAARCGSEPNERTPLAGSSRVSTRSAGGARLTVTPQSASRAPTAPATRSVSATSSATDSA